MARSILILVTLCIILLMSFRTEDNNSEAKALLLLAFILMIKVLGPGDPSTLLLYNLGLSLRRLGDANDALALMMDCYE